MALFSMSKALVLAVLLPINAASITVRQPAVPSYVTDYAPILWMHSSEIYWPSAMALQLDHTTPQSNFVNLTSYPKPLDLNNLDGLNALPDPTSIHLTSNQDISTNPNPLWLYGLKPDSSGRSDGRGGANNAIVVVNKGNGTVDAFYMYFYAYNRGNIVLGMEMGNHVGDWEHNMIRFRDGVPQAMWFSQHAGGEAFTYDCLEKNGLRPIVYCGKGSHANFAIAGTHSHVLPGRNLPFPFVLNDDTDAGTRWDPLLTTSIYSYNTSTLAFTPYDPAVPTAWLNYVGAWGDQEYPKEDARQRYLLGIELTAKYTSGPTGPRDKELARAEVCPDGISGGCVIRDSLAASEGNGEAEKALWRQDVRRWAPVAAEG